jgi:hypothetical protein
MNTDQELLKLAGAESENQTLFDELAGLVPAERLAEYYRVIAHTRTLSPNDEVLRVLEAMGILALLTRETPTAIAVERKHLQKILENALSKADEVEKRLAAYTSRLESRIAQLPKELETGLDPPRIARLLGESLRQCFQQSGLLDTAKALDQSCSEMNSVQEQLVNVLREVALRSEVKQHHAFLGECIDPRRGRTAQSTASVGTQFAHAEIVNQEVDDIRFLALCGGSLRCNFAGIFRRCLFHFISSLRVFLVNTAGSITVRLGSIEVA